MSGRQHIGFLREAAPVVSPSLLMCDFGNLQAEVARLEEAGVKSLHLDVMDGSFVPNFTYGMPIVAALRKLTDLPLDVHLMIDRPERYVRQFYEAGADLITIHAEATEQLEQTLGQIQALGAGAGIAINPDTPVSAIRDQLKNCDLVLVMSVPAGFGGQPFDDRALAKLEEVRELAPHALREIDGGVNASTIERCATAGAELFVVGSALFSQADYPATVRGLTELAAGAKKQV